LRVSSAESSPECAIDRRGVRADVVPLWGDGSVVVICHLRELMRDLRERRSHSNEKGVEAEFWGRSDQERVEAWIATGIFLIGAVAGVAGLTLLGRGFF
jgi:hypothetical protein